MDTGTVTVHIELPREDYERIEEQAHRERRSISEVIPSLIVDGLESRMTAREIMERVSAEYRARLAESGVRELTSEELLEKLQRDREEIANELYP